MTVQIKDSFILNNKKYSLCGIEGKNNLFNLQDYFGDRIDYNKLIISTACYRRYVARYIIKNNELKIDSLYIESKTDNLLDEILGTDKDIYVENRLEELNNIIKKMNIVNGINYDNIRIDDTYKITYKNLNIPIKFTGSLFICNDYINGYKIDSMITMIFEFKNVIELIFNNGVLINQIDHSKFVRKIRKCIDKNISDYKKKKNVTIDMIDDRIKDDFRNNSWWISNNFEKNCNKNKFLKLIY